MPGDIVISEAVLSSPSLLNAQDVAKLMTDPSAENRMLTAEKLGGAFASGAFGEHERALAEDIFRLMVRDVEVRVRASLSKSIRFSPDLPHEVAVALANDVADVALPIIESSSVLTDEDLIAIIGNKPAEYLIAIASRPEVSEKVSDTLVDSKNENVVTRLVSNDGAKLSENTMAKVLDDFGHIQRISNPMAERKVLPMRIAERLVNLVSERIKNHLVTHHDLSADVAMDLLLDSRERATLHLLDGSSDTPDIFDLVDQLYANGRLTSTIILRALCMGDLTFFEAALAKQAGIPISNAYQLIHDRGGNGLQRLFGKCGLPDRALDVARAALKAADDLGFIGTENRKQFQQTMIERVLTELEDDFDPENLDYFISKVVGRSEVVSHP